eukprot:8112279-Ditylum_brightwellii.AAC.1
MGNPPSVPLGHCESECDSDADCSEGLTCFQCGYNSALPYCSGPGYRNYDYCIDERKLGYHVCSKDDSATCGTFNDYYFASETMNDFPNVFAIGTVHDLKQHPNQLT